MPEDDPLVEGRQASRVAGGRAGVLACMQAQSAAGKWMPVAHLYTPYIAGAQVKMKQR